MIKSTIRPTIRFMNLLLGVLMLTNFHILVIKDVIKNNWILQAGFIILVSVDHSSVTFRLFPTAVVDELTAPHTHKNVYQRPAI